MSNNIWVPFDQKGSKKALDVIKKTKVDRGLMVKVTGTLEADRFVVSNLKEIKSDAKSH